MANVVSIQIQVDDNGAPQIIGQSEKALAGLGNTSEVASKRIASASGEVQQMLDNIGAAQKKYASAATAWQGPMSELGASFAAMGTAAADMDSLGMSFARMGKQATDATGKAAKPLNELGGHASTALDSVRLLSQEFGFRMPRAMEAMLSRIPFVTNGLQTMIGGMAAISGIEIFAHVGAEAYTFYERLSDVNAQVDKYLAKAAGTTESKLFDNASIETTVSLLNQVNDEIDSNLQKRANAGVGADNSNSVSQYARSATVLMSLADAPNLRDPMGSAQRTSAVTYNAEDAANLALDMARRDTLQDHHQEQESQNQEQLLKNRLEANSSSLQGFAAANETYKNALALAKQQQITIQTHERFLHDRSVEIRDEQKNSGMSDNDPALQIIYKPVADSGAEQRQTAEIKASEDLHAKLSGLDRKEADERIAAQNEAINSGLQGEARYYAMRQQAEDALVQKVKDGELERRDLRTMRALVDEKFDNEAKMRLEDLTAQTKRMADDTASAGLTGAAKLLADKKAQLGDIDRAENKYTGGTKATPEVQAQFDSQRASVTSQTNQKLTELDKQFTDHVNELVTQRTDASLSGYAKIDAAAQKQVQDLKRTYDQDYAHASISDAEKLKAAANLAAGIKAINDGAAQQKQQLTAKNNATDLQYDQEAAQAELRVRTRGIEGWSSAYRNAIAEIETQDQRRTLELQNQLNSNAISETEYQRRKVDIDRTANAEIAAQNQQLKQQVAGTLQEAFTNPLDFIKSRMEHMMFEVLASWIMQLNVFKKVFGASMDGLQPGANGAAASTSGHGAASFFTQALGFGQHLAANAPHAPSGTGGVIQSGTTLPAGYIGHDSTTGGSSFEIPGFGGSTSYGNGSSFGSQPWIGSGAGSDVSDAASGHPTRVLGISSAYTPTEHAESYGPGYSGSSAHTGAGTASNISSTVSDASTLMRQFGLTQSQAQAVAATSASPSNPSGSSAFTPGSSSQTTALMSQLGITSPEAIANGTADATTSTNPSAGVVTAKQPLSQQNIAGTVSSGISDASSLANMFGLTGGQAQGVSQSNPSAATNDLGTALGYAGAGMAAYQGTEGVMKGFHTGGINGALSSTMSGATAGAAIGSIVPGIGTVIGAAVGAIAGLTTNLVGDALDENNKFAARNYYKQTLFPQLEGVRTSFTGSGDYLTAVSEANKDASDGTTYMRTKWGEEAADYVNDNYLNKELTYVTSTIERMTRGNAADSGRTAAEFHGGGLIDGFGSLGTTANEGYIHAMLGEGIVNRPAMAVHGAGVGMMNNGASAAQMAAHYLAAAGGGSLGMSAGSTHYHTHQYNAIDAKSFGKFLDTGGMEQITKSANRRIGLYAGDGIG